MVNPLRTLHDQTDAEFQAYGADEIVSTFGQPQAEYAAIRKSVGLMDLPHRGVLEITGKDRFTFLNNLLTNQTYDKQTKSGMGAGTGVHALLLNAKSGRIIADMNAIETGEQTLLEMDARLMSQVKEALEKYRFAEQVKIVEGSGWHEIALHGPLAAGVLSNLTGRSIELGLLASTSVTLLRNAHHRLA